MYTVVLRGIAIGLHLSVCYYYVIHALVYPPLAWTCANFSPARVASQVNLMAQAALSQDRACPVCLQLFTSDRLFFAHLRSVHCDDSEESLQVSFDLRLNLCHACVRALRQFGGKETTEAFLIVKLCPWCEVRNRNVGPALHKCL